MIKKLMLCGLSVFSTGIIAQTAEDAYRFSQTHVTGSARNLSLGGAMGALGVDVSNAATNPAGMAIATKGEFYFSPAFYNTNTSSNYLGNAENDSKFKLGVNSLGLSLVSGNYKKGNEYRRLGLSFAVNNMARFSERRFLSATNKGDTYVDAMVKRLNTQQFTTNFDPFKENLFFNTAAFDTVPITDTNTLKAFGNYISNFGKGRAIQQDISENINGHISSFDISLFGTPNSDKLYFGVSLGIPILRYDNTFVLTDSDSLPNAGNSYSFPLRSYDYTVRTRTEGSGVNVKVGLIYRVTEFLRLGAYVHSPTAYTLSDNFSSSIRTTFYNSGSQANVFDADSPNGTYDYRVVTPFRAGLNFGFIFGKYAALGIDYETVGYNQARINDNTNINIFKAENNLIKSKYQRTENLRAGLEVNLKPIKLRVGYRRLGTGIVESPEKDKFIQQFSGGLGYSEGKWYFDAAVANSIVNNNYSAYEGAVNARINKKILTGTLTVGVRF